MAGATGGMTNPPRPLKLGRSRGAVWVTPEFEHVLKENGLGGFEEIMAVPVEEAKVMRSFPGRITMRLHLKGARVAYLKRYERHYLAPMQWLLRTLRWPSARDEAWREWAVLRDLAARNVAVPVARAVGQQRVLGVVARSFVMTEEIEGGLPADRYWRGIGWSERRALLLEIADFARAFHDLGYVHKDFYMNHFFVTEEGGKRRLHLLDLQRAMRPLVLRERWLIKDLGGLAFSVLNLGASRSDLAAFYRRYLRKERFEQGDKRRIRRINRRIAQFQRHKPKEDPSRKQG